MSEPDDISQENTPPVAPTKPGAMVGVRKFIFWMGILAVFWIIFGQLVPRLLFHATERHVKPLNNSGESAQQDGASETPAQKDQQIALLSSRVGELEAKVKTLEDVVAGGGKVAPDATQDARIDALQAKLDALAQASANVPVDATHLAHLEEKFDAQDKAVSTLKTQLSDAQAQNARALQIVTLIGQLKDAAAGGEGFASILNQLKALTDEHPAAQAQLAQLAPFADKGEITFATLQHDFGAALPAALSPAQSNALMDNVHSLIRIRKTGANQAGTDDQSVLARAEAKLGNNDVDGCLKELSQLSAPAAGAMAGWVSEAQAWQHFHATIDALQLTLATQSAPQARITFPAPAAPVTPAPTGPAALPPAHD